MVDSAAMRGSHPVRVLGFFLLFHLGILSLYAQTSPATVVTTGSVDDQMQAIANWILTEAPAIGCNPGHCKILVVNFLVPEGVDKRFGAQLADELSSKIVDPQKQIQVFSRNLFKSYIVASHADAGTPNDDQGMSALAHELGASALVTGRAVRVQGDTFRLAVRLVSAKDKNLIVTTEGTLTRTPPDAVPQGSAQEIAAKLAQKAEKVGCDSSHCTLLVMDFYTSSTSTSRAGVQLSDEFAVLLAGALPKVKIQNRSALRQFLNLNRIPVELLKNEDAERWSGRQLGATAVVTGEFNLRAGSSEVTFKVLDSRPNKKKVESFRARLPDLTIKPEELQAIEPYPKLERVIKNDQGEIVPWAAGNGVTAPHCRYMPNPPYTDEARQAKLSGVLTVDAIVTPQGTVQFERFVHGLPFNLNDQAIRVMGTWRCTPAMKDGRPVNAMVSFEVNFRLY